jgi:hypothetical protein
MAPIRVGAIIWGNQAEASPGKVRFFWTTFILAMITTKGYYE